MPDLSKLLQKYFKADDVRAGPLALTIRNVAEENVARKEEKPEVKPVVYFHEDPRGLMLNKTRYRALSDIFGSQNTDSWTGGSVLVCFDASIRNPNGGVGGIAVKPGNHK